MCSYILNEHSSGDNSAPYIKFTFIKFCVHLEQNQLIVTNVSMTSTLQMGHQQAEKDT